MRILLIHKNENVKKSIVPAGGVLFFTVHTIFNALKCWPIPAQSHLSRQQYNARSHVLFEAMSCSERLHSKHYCLNINQQPQHPSAQSCCRCQCWFLCSTTTSSQQQQHWSAAAHRYVCWSVRFTTIRSKLIQNTLLRSLVVVFVELKTLRSRHHLRGLPHRKLWNSAN